MTSQDAHIGQEDEGEIQHSEARHINDSKIQRKNGGLAKVGSLGSGMNHLHSKGYGRYLEKSTCQIDWPDVSELMGPIHFPSMIYLWRVKWGKIPTKEYTKRWCTIENSVQSESIKAIHNYTLDLRYCGNLNKKPDHLRCVTLWKYSETNIIISQFLKSSSEM